MELTLQKYGSYEKFEQATGGSLLSKTRIWSHVRKYMMKEGCLGEVSPGVRALGTEPPSGPAALAAGFVSPALSGSLSQSRRCLNTVSLIARGIELCFVSCLPAISM